MNIALINSIPNTHIIVTKNLHMKYKNAARNLFSVQKKINKGNIYKGSKLGRVFLGKAVSLMPKASQEVL